MKQYSSRSPDWWSGALYPLFYAVLTQPECVVTQLCLGGDVMYRRKLKASRRFIRYGYKHPGTSESDLIGVFIWELVNEPRCYFDFYNCCFSKHGTDFFYG